MTPAEALALAEKHAETGMVVDHITLRETDFGFYFHVASKAYLRTGDMMDMPVASFVAVQNASPSRSSSPLFKKPGIER
jgi:hypothetical protein